MIYKSHRSISNKRQSHGRIKKKMNIRTDSTCDSLGTQKIYKYLVILAVNFILIFSPSWKVDWYVVWWTADVDDSSRRQKGREAALYSFFINSLMVARGGLFLSKAVSGSRVERGLHFLNFYLQKGKVEGSNHLHY